MGSFYFRTCSYLSANHRLYNRNLNHTWTPAAILPNLSAREAVEGEFISIAPCRDQRVLAFSTAHPKFATLISRFTDAFHVPLEPVVLIVRDDMVPKLARIEPLASFRDLAALSVIPYARALGLVYRGGHHRISHSNSFWLYPWTLGTGNEYLVASTPALQGLHVVEEFYGQSSPDLSVVNLADMDKPLFEALLLRWKRHYLGKRQRWRDRALFRSLNMAVHAAQLPAGIDTTLYDLGLAAALWVSAFEILAHPRTANSGLSSVYPLLERVSYLDRKVRRRSYVAYTGRRNSPRLYRSLPCWLYGKLYQARCDFLHGNSLRSSPLNPNGSKVSLFWLAPCLYRLALTGFLGLSFKRKIPRTNDLHKTADYVSSNLQFTKYQEIIERALLRARK